MNHLEHFGYMCLIDWNYEVGQNARGNLVYPDIECLRERHNCADSCGIVKVKLTLEEIISPGTDG